MGYGSKKITVTVRVSRHNSDQDRLDESAADELADRIRMIAGESRYADIDPDVEYANW